MNPLNVEVSNEPLINMNIPRIERGMELMDQVEVIGETGYVRSTKDKNKIYEVNYLRNDCTCPDNQYRHVTCKHLRAVNFFLGRKNERV